MWPFTSSSRGIGSVGDSRSLPVKGMRRMARLPGMTTLGLCLSAVLALSSVSADLEAAQVYRHVDANGNVVFSDQPAGGSKVKLTPLSVVPSTEAAPSRAPASRGVSSSPSETASRSRPSAPAVDVSFRGYTRFFIQSPSNEETLPTGQAGNLAVRLAIEPQLRPEHKVRVTVDGAPSQSAMNSSVFMVPGLERGKHVIQAELLDASGRVRQTTEPRVVYVQRASVNLPRNPNNPANAGGG